MSLGKTYKRGSVAGWSTSMGLSDEVLVTPEDRLESLSRDLVWVPGLNFLTFNTIQSRAVTGFLTGHNTLRIHLYLLGLLDSPLCRKCRVREETSAHILCECEALASLRHAHLGSFSLEPEDIRSLVLGAIWNYSKVTGLP